MDLAHLASMVLPLALAASARAHLSSALLLSLLTPLDLAHVSAMPTPTALLVLTLSATALLLLPPSSALNADNLPSAG